MNEFDVAERYVIELCFDDEGVVCKLGLVMFDTEN